VATTAVEIPGKIFPGQWIKPGSINLIDAFCYINPINQGKFEDKMQKMLTTDATLCHRKRPGHETAVRCTQNRPKIDLK